MTNETSPTSVHSPEPEKPVASLRISELRYRRLFEAARDGILLVDAGTRKITDANPFIQELLKYSHEELVDKELWEIGLLKDEQASAAAFEVLQREGYIRYDDLPLQTKDGRRRDVEFVSNVYDEGGQQVIQCNIRDITQQKDIEDKQYQSEANLAAAQRISHVGSWELDLSETENINRNPLHWSDEVFRIFGYEPGQIEVSNENFFRAVHPDDRELVRGAMMQALKNNQPYCIEHRILLPGGNERVVHEHAEIVFDERSGKTLKMVGTVQDITERKQAEAEREAKSREIATIWESMTDAFFSLDRQWRFTHINSQCARLVRKTASELIGVSLWDAFPETIGSKFEQEFRRAAEEQVPVSFEAFYHPHDVWYEAHVYPSPLGLSIYFRDVTDRKQFEVALQENEAQFRSLVEAIPQIVWVTRPDGWHTHFNQRWMDFTGLTLEESLGYGWNPPFHPEDRPRAARLWQNATQSGEPYEIEYRLRRADGVYHWMLGRALPLRDASGAILKWFGTCTDIHDLKQAEEAAQEGAQQLRVLAAQLESERARLVDAQAVAKVGSWETDLSTLQVGWSAEMFRIVETDPEQFRPTHQGFLGWVHPEDRAAVDEAFFASFDIQLPCTIEHRLLMPDGRIKFVEQRWRVAHDEQGKAVRATGTMQDITERRQAEEELLASEEKFQSIVANVPGTVYQFARHFDGRLEWPFVSEGCREMFEVEPEEIERNPNLPLDMVHPEDRDGFNRSVTIAKETLAPWSWEGRIRTPSGKLKWIQGASYPQRLPDGGVVCTGLFMDITAYKTATAERDRFFTMSLDMLGIAGTDGYFKRLNPAFSEVLGYTESELLARPFLEFVHPDDQASTIEAIEGLVRGDVVVGFENRYRSKDGSWRWLEWKSVAAVEEGLIYAAARDVTERRRGELALYRANDELELHVAERTAELEASNRALHNNEARLLRGNSIFTELTHLRVSSEDELPAVLAQVTEAGSALLDVERCSIWLYNDEETAIRCLDLYQRSLQRHSEGNELSVEEYPEYFRHLATRHAIIAEDAHTHPATREFSTNYLVPLGIHSMLDAPIVIGGQMVGVVCCEHKGESRRWQVEDQTFAGALASICSLALEAAERTRVEAALRQSKEEAEFARQEAEQANLAKSEFLSRMSHELRTPLNAILGFGQILNKQDLTMLQKESVGHVLNGGRHLLGLINEVLDIARVESGGDSILVKSVALEEVVLASCDLVRPLTSEGNISLGYDLSDAERIHVLADPQRLKQVLINLLSNAIKYNRRDGQVTVLCRRLPDKRVRIAVRDTGPGIAPKDLPKLFTPFERLDAANSDVEGTGLGLMLSQRLVTAMDGTLEVESVLGQGSTFFVTLPQAGSVEETPRKTPVALPAATPVPPSQREYSLLCIEDNLSNLRLIELFLQARPEITLLSATRGIEGLDLAHQHEPLLILLDLNLPDMHGEEVLKRLQQSALTRDIPVAIVSADATPPQIQRLLEVGASAYLTKPLDEEQFLDTLDEFARKALAAG